MTAHKVGNRVPANVNAQSRSGWTAEATEADEANPSGGALRRGPSDAQRHPAPWLTNIWHTALGPLTR